MQSERPAAFRIDRGRSALDEQIEQTYNQPNNPSVETVCKDIKITWLNDMGEPLGVSQKSKPTDLDLTKLQKRYLHRQSIIDIHDAARTFNGVQQLFNLYKEKKAEAVEKDNIQLFKKYVQKFDEKLDSRLYANQEMILRFFETNYDVFEESMKYLFQNEADWQRHLSVNDYMDAKVPDFLTEEKAKEIRDEINAFRE